MVVEAFSLDAEAGPSTPSTWPIAPVFNFSNRPTALTTVDACELSSQVKANFFRHARWSPDGSAILTTAEDRALRVYHTSPVDPEPVPRTINQPDSIHSTLWYPTASAISPETFCFVASVRDTPLRLLDANDGRIRAAYPIIDHRERFIAPHSLAFNSTATKLYCGHENAIEVIDVSTPGDNSERLKTTITRRGKGGQKGIISALAFSPDHSGTFAAGSFAGSVSLYSEDTGSNPLQHLEGISGGGVTQLAFHPLSPQLLFVASRRSSAIQIFDTRHTSQGPIVELRRKASTNQRIWFDVDPWGRWIASGDEEGIVRIWDISEGGKETPVFEEQLHDDVVNSVQSHPFSPMLLTASGSRSYLDTEGSGSSSESSSDSGSDPKSDSDPDSDSDAEVVIIGRSEKGQVNDGCMKIWSMAPTDQEKDVS
ncbi:telomerase Cajal body protein 1, partial [Tremellales sp. Uapishka_1]